MKPPLPPLLLLLLGLHYTHGMLEGNPNLPFGRMINYTDEYSEKTKPEYYIMETNTSCTQKYFHITIKLNKPFQGVIYAKGYPRTKNRTSENECYSFGTGEEVIDIKFDSKSCGVRLYPIDDNKLAYSLKLILQMDKFLQQITNQEISSMCIVAAHELGMRGTYRQRARGGRKLDITERESDIIDNIRAWLELKSPHGLSQVTVGQNVKAVVKTLLPAYMSATVTSCTAYDGLQERSQPLTNGDGCAFDPSLMPALNDYSESKEDSPSTSDKTYSADAYRPFAPRAMRSGRAYDISENSVDRRTTLRVSGTIFPAFKFPDTANLHIKCTLVICRFACPLNPCNGTSRNARHLQGSKILETMDVFNSIEVIAPGIDDIDVIFNKDSSRKEENFFCLSPSKMAFIFAIVVGIFIVALFSVIIITMRKKATKLKQVGHRYRCRDPKLRGPFADRTSRHIRRQNIA